jgi:lysophospholipase L1-like esterase
MANERRPKKWIIRQLTNILVSFCSIFLLLIILEISFRVYEISVQKKSIAIRAYEDFWCQYDPVLGWKHIPGKVVSHAYQNIPVVINKEGVRADREYGFERKRILAVGCSFTFGHGVEGKAAWPQRLEHKLQSNGFDYDVINAGVCAYGIDQIYLWFLEKQKVFKPNIVILGLTDYLDRIVRCRWLTGHGKPRYRLIMGKLILINVPTPRRVQPGNTYSDWTNLLFDFNKSYLIGFFINRLAFEMPFNNNKTEELQIAQKILLEFSQKCKENNAKFLTVFINPIPDLEGFLLKNKIDFTNCSEMFHGQGDIYLKNDGHPTSHGHDLIAEQVYRFLVAHRKENHL